MKIVSCNGYEDNNSSYISFSIDHVKENHSCGDMFWNDGNELLVSDLVDRDDIAAWARETGVPGDARRVILGYLDRMGVI